MEVSAGELQEWHVLVFGFKNVIWTIPKHSLQRVIVMESTACTHQSCPLGHDIVGHQEPHQEKVLCFNMHVTLLYRCQHACSSSQHEILQKSHVNIMADFSMSFQNSNMAFQNSNMAFQNFNMSFQNSEHGVSKLRTWRFTRCRARTSNDAVEGKGVGQWLLRLTPVYLRPQKKSPHGLHHLLG